ncbi:hypothetical protein [Nocardia huaxiensis]|uniref:Uncharacterized protein n=1 Tax=Nocardia huaxiensis TaxID=2755382 RepID=A0A7D6VB63_9NOCA|nr:hypothetical protein [Nocardia huaxiensis]QLY31294.1 hypothetical protein H0264_02715 [Nocardia huaxiensis]UFS94834.1 hypothetical protein LPY97_29540 [Nocardia huaxiensis]
MEQTENESAKPERYSNEWWEQSRPRKEGHWTGGGKAVWGAILAGLVGCGGLFTSLQFFAANDLEFPNLWGYLVLGAQVVLALLYLVGAVLLLCRQQVGQILLGTACALTLTFMVLGLVIGGVSEDEPGTAIGAFGLVGLIAWLSVGKSTRAWIAKGRAAG